MLNAAVVFDHWNCSANHSHAPSLCSSEWTFTLCCQ